jgi:hypothetical protein
MKALLYKELKLAMHPICYVFIALFPFMILIPSYPIAIGFLYVLTCYPILFLGANKGQQSNDLLYSTLLPIRKKDIVKARIMTVLLMHVVFIALTTALFPLAVFINNSINDAVVPGLGLHSYVLVLAIVIIGYAIADLIFFPIYYKNGKSIVMSTLMMILGFVLYLGIFTIGLPFIPGLEWINELPLYVQFIILGISLIIYIALHLVVYKVSYKRLEKVDF